MSTIGNPTPPPPPGPSGKVLAVLITMLALLMLFSVASWALGNQTLAVAAGVAAIALIGDICRRLLAGNETPPLDAPSSAAPPPALPPSPSASHAEPDALPPPVEQPTIKVASPVDGDSHGSQPAAGRPE